ncbi:RagB/SusD family nutrient uptake outer membrane protein [Chryseobacterium sp. A301]
MKKYFKLLFCVFVCIQLTNCRDFLNEKSDSKLSIIQDLSDIQALLDGFGTLNTLFVSDGETSSDDFYLTDNQYNSLNFEEDKRLYIWMEDNVSKSSSLGNAWLHTYRAIFTCNSALSNLETLGVKSAEADYIKGQALFLRAARYLDAVQIWCVAYDEETASETLGLPLRLDPDMNIPSQRASLEETYDQIVKDLEEAVIYLKDQEFSKLRASRPAAFGLLARAYLYMGDYDQSLIYSEKALSITNSLMDYSKLDVNAAYPFNEMNEEVLFWCGMDYEYHLRPARIVSSLYEKYDHNDLRKQLYFYSDNEDEIYFKGYSAGSNGSNVSASVSEMYLIRAESLARKNKVSEAMVVLNDLLKWRWVPGTYVPFTSSTQDQALRIILEERRKELLIRGLRWPDIKRYNRDGANITLKRTLNGQVFTLPPNDPRFAIAIPEELIKLSGIKQNPR